MSRAPQVFRWAIVLTATLSTGAVFTAASQVRAGQAADAALTMLGACWALLLAILCVLVEQRRAATCGTTVTLQVPPDIAATASLSFQRGDP